MHTTALKGTARKAATAPDASDGALIGKRLKAARLRAQLTQQVAATSGGVGIATLQLAERDGSTTSQRTLRRLCEVYGCRLSELFAPPSDEEIAEAQKSAEVKP
jgi:transcriptional regulator with XRE-family HTH domain